MKSLFLTLSATIIAHSISAQYAPQVPLAGHDAIHRNDTLIKAWATACSVERGWVQISDTILGKVSAGTLDNALGKADNLTLSLGDGGYAIVTFETPITNGEGADFVVYENAIKNNSNDSLAFLELATVAVSSNGIDFVTFPAVSNTPTDIQVDTFGFINASLIQNLAGKYTANWGTPFDLELLRDEPNLDITRITHIKITDVVGSIDERWATYDSNGNIINDPFPTPYFTGGFDLDAVGAIHLYQTNSINPLNQNHLQLYPNPTSDLVNLNVNFDTYTIFNVNGLNVTDQTIRNGLQISLAHLPTGIYKLGCIINETWVWHTIIKE